MTHIPGIGRFATRHALAITFIAAALCVAGIFSALNMPSSVFPHRLCASGSSLKRVWLEI